jgi:hypothetical protein
VNTFFKHKDFFSRSLTDDRKRGSTRDYEILFQELLRQSMKIRLLLITVPRDSDALEALHEDPSTHHFDNEFPLQV